MPKLMGIVNVTADSFSGDGQQNPPDAVELGLQHIREGADLLDVGAESTRPGAQPVPEKHERARITSVISALVEQTTLPVSCDTYKPAVAQAAIAAGATMINDITGLRTPGMCGLVAESSVEVCIMHMQGTPATMQERPVYVDVVADVCQFLGTQADSAVDAGVKKDRIYLDPGIGFGKTVGHNLSLLAHVDEVQSLGFKTLVGASRKSFIGAVLDHTLVEDRLAGTLAVTYHLAAAGVDVIRVHDVAANRQVLSMADALSAAR